MFERSGALTRTTGAFVALLLCTITAVVLGASSLVRRDRARLMEQFASERLEQVGETARAIQSELDDVGEDLRFAASLLNAPGGTAQHEAELRALLQVVTQYKAVAVFGAEGREILVVDPAAATLAARPEVEAALTQTAAQALTRAAGEIVTSRPLSDVEWIRVFATPVAAGTGNPRAVAVAVDLEPYFSSLRLITTDPDAHVLVLGTHGHPTPASERRLASHVRALGAGAPSTPGFARVVERMRAGDEGQLRIDEAESRRLGLGEADLVAAFAPVEPRGGARWSVATFTSARALRSLENAVALRLGAAAATVVLLLCAFGVYAVIAARRAVALSESRRHADRLEHLHEKTQKILDHIPTAVMALSADGRITTANAALRNRLGEVPVGTALQAAFPAAPRPSVERLRSLFDAACATNQPKTLPGEALSLFGEPGQYNLHAVPLEHADPEVRALLVIEDLSNVQALESQLLRAEKLATVGVLAAGIAHEIGTPLGVVRGRAEYLLGKLGPGSPHASGVEVIIEQIDRVSRTIRQLLDFSRIQQPQVRAVELTAVAHATVELLGLEADRRGLSFELRVPPQLPLLSADPDQLQQVLVNVVMNAFDACAPGARVTLEADVEAAHGSALGGRVEIRVRDTGAGIPPERLEQVFDPFFTTKKRGQGTGLGLTLVAQIVRNHGGQVAIDSEVGRGTCVTLRWPTSGSVERHAVP